MQPDAEVTELELAEVVELDLDLAEVVEPDLELAEVEFELEHELELA